MKQRNDTEIHRLGQDSEFLTGLNVTIRQGTQDRLNLNTRGETDNWWKANKRQEKLIRITNRLINRTVVVDGDRKIQEVAEGRWGRSFRTKTENTWHDKTNTRST